MKKTISIIMVIGLSACGGRVAVPIEAENSFDEKLSCGHLEAEKINNDKRVVELVGESSKATRDNLGRVAISAVSPANILFLDLSETKKEETEALVIRNARLEELMTSKSCEAIASN